MPRRPEGNQGEEQEIEQRPNDGQPNGVILHQEYRAPLPPGAEFERYENVLPGAADRILKMAERQSGHRHFAEKLVVIAQSIKALGGLLGGLIVVLVGMWLGFQLILAGQPIAGFLSLMGPLSTIAAVFVIEKRKEDSDD